MEVLFPTFRQVRIRECVECVNQSPEGMGMGNFPEKINFINLKSKITYFHKFKN